MQASGFRFLLSVFLISGFCLLAPPSARAVLNDGMNAVDLLGQYTTQTSSASVSYTKWDMNDGPGQLGFYSPFAEAIDTANHRLFVADQANARVLEYNLNTDNTLPDKVPDHVLGQSSFNSSKSSVTQAGMGSPEGLAFDAVNNRLFVADTNYNRVLVYNTSTITDGMNAANVLGEPSFTTWGTYTPTQAQMHAPLGLAFDAVNNRLFVADSGSNRVLVYNTSTITNGMNAANVLGQANFTSSTAATTQAGMHGPAGLAFDATNNLLFVADEYNDRTLVFNTSTITDGMNAADLLAGSSAAGTSNLGFSSDQGIALDSTNHRLFVADTSNNRVLEYNLNTDNTLPDKVPDHVLGQSDFISNGRGGTLSGMYCPTKLAFDTANNRLFVADTCNNRVLVFNTSTITDGMAAADSLGLSTNSLGFYSALGVFYGQGCMALDATNHRLFMTDSGNNRVLEYDLNTDNTLPDKIPDHVLGQPDFTTGGAATSQSGMNMPYGLAFDATNNRLFVGDANNNRVLVYDLSGGITDGMNAANVLGQAVFTTSTAATTQAGMNYPGGLAFDATNNRLLVVDTNNNRVTIFPTASITDGENATDELGQYASTTSSATVVWTTNGKNNINDGSAFNLPRDLALDGSNHRLFVADTNDSRVLEFNLNTDDTFPDKVPDHVLGQAGFLSTGYATTQAGMKYPSGLTFDSGNNRLFVADLGNQRVLAFNTSTITDGMNASNVLGQTNFTSNTGTTTQAGLYNPWGLAFDAGNSRLFVADQYNNRVIVYNLSGGITDGMNAANVLGQANFTTKTIATTQAGMNSPEGLAFDSGNNRLFVADSSNNRVTIFPTASITDGENASDELGEYSTSTSSATVVWTKGGANNTPNEAVFGTATGLALDGANHRLFVADISNNRVLEFNLNTDGTFPDKLADHVLGQANFGTSAIATTQAGLHGPWGLEFDAANNRLFVADTNNERVMIFGTASITDGENASDELGQYNSTSSSATVVWTKSDVDDGPGPLGFNWPTAVTLDSTNHRLFVSDSDNNRVLEFNLNTDNTLPDKIPDHVLGQPDFMSSNYGTTQSAMDDPTALAVDGPNNRLFVADSKNNRVLVFNTSTITDGMNAAHVLGQANYTSYAAATTQAGMYSPFGLEFDAANNRLFVADSYNYRVLVFNTSTITDGMNASNVLGQPNFTTATCSGGAASLCEPNGVAFDAGNNRLFVADTYGSCGVNVYDTTTITNGMSASNVLGQADYTSCPYSLSQSRMYFAVGVAYDAATNRLFASDTDAARALAFNTATVSTGMNASNVLGAPNFTTSGCCLSQSAWEYAYSDHSEGLYYDQSNSRLYVVDSLNNRIMIFDGTDLSSQFMQLLPY